MLALLRFRPTSSNLTKRTNTLKYLVIHTLIAIDNETSITLIQQLAKLKQMSLALELIGVNNYISAVFYKSSL